MPPRRTDLKFFNGIESIVLAVIDMQGKEPERETSVDGTLVKVKADPADHARPEYRCHACGVSFPSELDLTEHEKIDHQKKASISA